jgi:hypothetical protein
VSASGSAAIARVEPMMLPRDDQAVRLREQSLLLADCCRWPCLVHCVTIELSQIDDTTGSVRAERAVVCHEI